MTRDIYPRTPVERLSKAFTDDELSRMFDLTLVSALVGMQPSFIKTALASKESLVSLAKVLDLLELDSFAETFVPRSKIPSTLLAWDSSKVESELIPTDKVSIHQGCVTELVRRLPKDFLNCVVTSPPYWGLRLYDKSFQVEWKDGEVCAFGNEQTPEAYIRHTIEVLFYLKNVLKADGSVWWNVMDSYNTRTQIRGNASETLRAMQGKDDKGWKDHAARRYSAGHSFLKDGEQCLIPVKIAERASRLGFFVKSVITWKKNGSLPETVQSRVTRELEYILHLSIQRTPYFDKKSFLELPENLGGRNRQFESEKITDVWTLRTSSGLDGHGAQFPIELPARCIALSTKEDDVVLDPFIGAGTTALAAIELGRKCIGFDVSEKYIEVAQKRVDKRGSNGKRLAAPTLFN